MKVVSPIHGRETKVDFRVDTGADMTLVPGMLIPELGTKAFDEVIIADFDSRTVRYDAHVVHLRLNGRIFENVEVIASETDTAYLGLDILNRIKVTLDGPKKSLIIH